MSEIQVEILKLPGNTEFQSLTARKDPEWSSHLSANEQSGWRGGKWLRSCLWKKRVLLSWGLLKGINANKGHSISYFHSGRKWFYTTIWEQVKLETALLLTSINGINEILTNGDNIGRRRVMVAALLATSVKDVTSREDIRIISHTGNDPRGDNLFPIHRDSPDL